MFEGLQQGKYQAILADPPWTFQAWYAGGWRKRKDGSRYYSAQSPKSAHYDTIAFEDICGLPVKDLAAKNCVLFLWGCWPILPQCLDVIKAWGFTYKSCAFVWTKANLKQIDMFRDDADPDMLLGYWTRTNTEFCLLGTRGKPKRLATNIRQAIVAPRKAHSQKPDGIHERIERLVAGPYCELFAREKRNGWDCWGNEIDKFKTREHREQPSLGFEFPNS